VTGASRRILVTGAGGLIGRALVPALASAGHRVVRAVRRTPRGPDEVAWDPSRGLEPNDASRFDAVVHLAGESLASGRWTRGRKKRIWDSRVVATRRLCESLAALRHPPAAFVGASAIGGYGDTGEAWVDETWPAGHTFLARLVREWESAADPARAAGIRVAHLRLGLVLARGGGALEPLRRVFGLGLGGPIAGGRAWWSWIAIDDVVGLAIQTLEDGSASGATNAVSPHPVRNAEFTGTLARVLGRPALLPVPAFALRLLFGAEMADQTLLASNRVSSERARAQGYAFRYPELAPALEHLIQAPAG
jgi:uncharacterized protein (TIGR01777 family)